MQFFKRFARPRPRRPSAACRANLRVEQLETRLALALPPAAPFDVTPGTSGTSQTSPSGAEGTAINPNGGFVFTWSTQKPGNSWGVYAQSFNANGTPITGPTQISSSV